MLDRNAKERLVVTIVNKHNRHLYSDALEEMFQFRHAVAIGEMGWSLPHAEQDREQDQFDTDDAIYFLDWDQHNNMAACCRLVPTDKPHLISEIFPTYCDFGNIPRDPKILEVSRFLSRKTGLSKEATIRARHRVMVAIHEYGHANGVTHFTALTYQKHYELAAYLFRTRPLGMAHYCEADDDHYIAIIKEVSANGIARMRKHLGVQGDVVHYNLPLWAVGQLDRLGLPRRSSMAA